MGDNRLTPCAAAAAALMMLACSGGDDVPRPKPPAAKAAPATAQQTGTALAAVAPAEPPPAKVVEEVPDEPPVDDFRQRVVAAMSATLGAPPKTRQDAINAAYRHIGWEDGEQPTDRDNHDAYHQACRWGFHLGDFAKAGRHGAFDPRELASAPLDEHAHRAWTRQGHGHRVAAPALAARDRAAPGSRAAPEEPAGAVLDDGGDERARRIANLTLRLEQLAKTTNDLNAELNQLERDANARDLPEARVKALRQRADSVRELIRYAEASALKLEESLVEARED